MATSHRDSSSNARAVSASVSASPIYLSMVAPWAWSALVTSSNYVLRWATFLDSALRNRRHPLWGGQARAGCWAPQGCSSGRSAPIHGQPRSIYSPRQGCIGCEAVPAEGGTAAKRSPEKPGRGPEGDPRRPNHSKEHTEAAAGTALSGELDTPGIRLRRSCVTAIHA